MLTAENRSNNNYIGLGKTKAITLSDAGLPAASVAFTKVKQDLDNGMSNYDLDFYTAAREYDYRINAQTDAIIDRSAEVNEHTVHETKPMVTTAPTAATTEASRGFVGVDHAKSIALGHAGVSVSLAFSSKTRPGDDDGRGVYEVEFYASSTEYNYGIDAHSGVVLGTGTESN